MSSYDDFPPEAKSLPRVGALLDPDMERILTLRPDLVVSYGSQTDLHTQLGRAHIEVFSYRHAGLDGIFQAIGSIGVATGRQAGAEMLTRRVRAQLDAVRTRVQRHPRRRVLLVFEREPTTLRGIYASGGRGFMHDMLEVAGGTNVFADIQREAVQPSQEMLLARAPDVIIEVRGTALAEAADPAAGRQAWAPLGSIPAVRDGRIYFLNGDYLVVPGPRVGQGIEAIARALHPEAFR